MFFLRPKMNHKKSAAFMDFNSKKGETFEDGRTEGKPA